jgi:hypothetical protein
MKISQKNWVFPEILGNTLGSAHTGECCPIPLLNLLLPKVSFILVAGAHPSYEA